MKYHVYRLTPHTTPIGVSTNTPSLISAHEAPTPSEAVVSLHRAHPDLMPIGATFFVASVGDPSCDYALVRLQHDEVRAVETEVPAA